MASAPPGRAKWSVALPPRTSPDKVSLLVSQEDLEASALQQPSQRSSVETARRRIPSVTTREAGPGPPSTERDNRLVVIVATILSLGFEERSWMILDDDFPGEISRL